MDPRIVILDSGMLERTTVRRAVPAQAVLQSRRAGLSIAFRDGDNCVTRPRRQAREFPERFSPPPPRSRQQAIGSSDKCVDRASKSSAVVPSRLHTSL